jgi:DNA-binding response OmpR family regulator
VSRILVAEDEARISAFVCKGLQAAGHSASVAVSGADALELAESGDFDLLVLDIGLPGVDGFEVLKRLRNDGSELPVVILTARDSARDVVAGLDGGADDYLSKPFRFDELLARIRRRLVGHTATGAITLPTEMLVVGDLTLELRERRVIVGGLPVELSTREFALAEEFFRHPDQILSREDLLSRVWGYDFDPGSNVVDVYVRYLRNKIGKSAIDTVRGAGYRLAAPNDPRGVTNDSSGPGQTRHMRPLAG